MDDIQFDYKNQAWIKHGRYIRCGHPADMDCQCYGRIHEGERRQGNMIVYIIMESPDRYTPAYEIERIEDDRPRAFMRLDMYRAKAEPEGFYDPRYYLLSTLKR
jgi:hypothetical protein